MLFKVLAAALGAASLSVATAASAETIILGGSFSSAGGAPSFYTANFDFSLPSNFTNARLVIESLSVDDRGVLQLNGERVFGAGIFGYAAGGSFDYNDGAGNVPFPFRDNGLQNATVAGPFVAGVNSLLLLVNDTGQGIYGTFTNGPSGPSSPTGYSFAGRVEYDLRTGAVPEPATWALMIMGFGSAGAMLRRRRTALA